jgi:hypothetical protein
MRSNSRCDAEAEVADILLMYWKLNKVIWSRWGLRLKLRLRLSEEGYGRQGREVLAFVPRVEKPKCWKVLETKNLLDDKGERIR